MNFDKIEQIINLVKSNDVKKFKYKDFENEIELDFTEPSQPQSSINQSSEVQNSSANKSVKNEDSSSNQSEGQDIKSQMVGTFFLQDSKELTDPVVKVGDTIKTGDIVGYVEAMKVMNEITSDVDGEITEILVDHGTNVEYGQSLIKVK